MYRKNITYVIRIDSYTYLNTQLAPLFVCPHHMYKQSDILTVYPEYVKAYEPKLYENIEEAKKVVAAIELALKYDTAVRRNPGHFPTNVFDPLYQAPPDETYEMREVVANISKFHQDHIQNASKPFDRLMDLLEKMWDHDNKGAAVMRERIYSLQEQPPLARTKLFEHEPVVILRVLPYEKPAAEAVLVSYN
jgi:hypothetical protein